MPSALYGSGQPVSGSLSAAGNGNPFTPGPGYGQGRYNLSVGGTFSATWKLQRSFDGGQTWNDASNAGAAQTFTGPFSEVLIEPGTGNQVRVVITAYTSGTLTYAFSQ